jgi:hypothetical protein
MDAYGVSEAYLLDSQPEGVTSEHIVFSTKKKRKYRGMCPKGFSDYDIEGELCKCEESACEHLERVPPAPPRGKSDALMEVQMASVSTGIYMAESPVSGWSLKVLWDQHWDHSQLIDPDISGIYVKMFPTSVKPTCVLVFSGTSSLKEVAEDLNIKETTYCDGQFKRVHKGFVDKANTFMGPTWDKMMNYLLDQEKCGGGVIFAGHSLGGAAADLFAACFNLKRKHSAELPSHLQGVRELYPIVDSVWTIGAPAITKDKPLSNALAEDGCFEGGRWYNQDHDGSYDPVPILAKHVGFLHPRMTAVAVYKDPHITQFRKRYCDGEDLEGNTKKLQAPDLVPAAQVRSLLSRPLKSFLLHKKDPYITRMMAAAESPDLTHAVEFPNLP